MPEIYCPTIQTVETTTRVTGGTIDPNDLISIFLHEAEHRVIAGAQETAADAAMLASWNQQKSKKRKERIPIIEIRQRFAITAKWSAISSLTATSKVAVRKAKGLVN